jgi:hypothetical protein
MMKTPEQEHMPHAPDRFSSGIAHRENSFVEIFVDNVSVSRSRPSAFLNETSGTMVVFGGLLQLPICFS